MKNTLTTCSNEKLKSIKSSAMSVKHNHTDNLILFFREALRVASTLLHAAGRLLITSASMISRIIEGAEFWQPQRTEYNASWN